MFTIHAMNVDNPDARSQSDSIRSALLQAVQRDDPSPVRSVALVFGVTRQAVNRHLSNLIAEGWIQASGQTRNRRYELRAASSDRFVLKLAEGLEEDVVWREHVRPALGDAPANVVGICQYGLTEIVNNAIDHSNGTTLTIDVQRTALDIVMQIADDGVGVFQKIRSAFQYADDQQAVLELSKGKLTTDRTRHPGEGVFFVSRAVDVFEICSDRLTFRHDSRQNQWHLLPADDCPRGTRITLVIAVDSQRTLQDVFDHFTRGADDYGFTRTQVPVFLAQYGDENLVSRSQARRVLLRLDLFSDILFDFQGVATIGQGFADEVFRVYQRQHPESVLNWAHVTSDIERMIRRARAGLTTGS